MQVHCNITSQYQFNTYQHRFPITNVCFQEYIIGLCNHVLNFKQLKNRRFFFKGGSSLVRFIKQKTFNIINFSVQVLWLSSKDVHPSCFFSTQFKPKQSDFSPFSPYFFSFPLVIILGLSKTRFTSTYSSRNSDKGFPALLKSHPQRERASFLWMIKVV